MASRTLYVGQTVQIKTADGGTYYLPVTSASCEVSRPIEFVTTFGHINNVAAAQNNFTTCKGSIKTYLIVNNSTGVTGAAGFAVGGTGLSTYLIQRLTGDAVTGAKDVITVSPNGFTMSGILSSIGMDASFGSFATADLTFNGLGEPFFDVASSTTSVPVDSVNMPTGITPVVSQFISGVTGCANSFKFTLDLPNEPLACLGDVVTGRQETIVNSVLVLKFPLKASLTLEGYNVDISSADENAAGGAGISTQLAQQFNIGGIKVQLPNPKVTSKSMNQAVGAVGATYNFTAEDVSAVFS